MPRRWTRLRLLATTGALAAVTLAGLPAAGAALPVPGDFGPAIEPLSGYQGQTVCDPTDKPGTVALRTLLQQSFGANGGGISRACSGSRSEHSEGRAYDFMLDANKPADRAKADAFLSWLLSPDCRGNSYAMARRLGVMYVIWDGRTWEAYAAARGGDGWKAYSGYSPHRDHIHISLNPAGAAGQTSYWTQPSSGSCTAGGTTQTDAQAYVSALYPDLLSRTVDPAGLMTWSAELVSGRLSREQLAYRLATTDEWLGRLVDGYYLGALGRPADSGGRAYWVSLMRQGMRPQDVAVSFYSSPESFAQAGNDVDRWVDNLYRQLLGRSSEDVGRRHWVDLARTNGRGYVASFIYDSAAESLQRRVRVLYEVLLNRQPDAAGLATWPAQVQVRGDIALAATLASSEEYLLRARAGA